MSNPIDRLISITGLVMLLPIGYLLTIGNLTPQEAGIRAALTLAAVIVIRRLARIGMGVVATSMERRAAAAPRRRAADQA
jgi:hypothetical protein